MNSIRKALLTLVVIVFSLLAKAQDHPRLNLGVYGIQYHQTVEEYQRKYVGETVMYLPQRRNGGEYDSMYFIDKGGKYYTKYVISEIKGDNERMVFTLVEKGKKEKVKMTVNNRDLSSAKGKDYYCISDWYTIPLLLFNKYGEDKLSTIGKVFPERKDSPVYWEITDMDIGWTSDMDYPIVYCKFTNKESQETFTYNALYIDIFNDLGKKYHNPKFKCFYTVVKIFEKYEYSNKPKTKEYVKYYALQNSINGRIKEVKINEVEKEVFYMDDKKAHQAVLVKVEKPSNPAVRYGETTTISEEGITKFSYIDNFIDIKIFASKDDFNFVLNNLSDHTLKIIWDEAVFVDVNGTASKVMHSGIRFLKRADDQPASVIIKGSKLRDVVTPINRVYYNDTFSRWDKFSLFLNSSRKSVGETFKLMLPIQVKDVTNEYIFEFEIKYEYVSPELIADEFLDK